MLLVPTTELIPLVADANGVIHVGRTRVTLDTVIAAFLEGSSAEEIGEQYSSLQLSDIYSAIGYYLRYRVEVDTYGNWRLWYKIFQPEYAVGAKQYLAFGIYLVAASKSLVGAAAYRANVRTSAIIKFQLPYSESFDMYLI